MKTRARLQCVGVFLTVESDYITLHVGLWWTDWTWGWHRR